MLISCNWGVRYRFFDPAGQLRPGTDRGEDKFPVLHSEFEKTV